MRTVLNSNTTLVKVKFVVKSASQIGKSFKYNTC